MGFRLGVAVRQDGALLPARVTACQELTRLVPALAEALQDSAHGKLWWCDTARASVQKPSRMERLLPSARRWRATSGAQDSYIHRASLHTIRAFPRTI